MPQGNVQSICYIPDNRLAAISRPGASYLSGGDCLKAMYNQFVISQTTGWPPYVAPGHFICPVVNASRQCTINLLYPGQQAGRHITTQRHGRFSSGGFPVVIVKAPHTKTIPSHDLQKEPGSCVHICTCVRIFRYMLACIHTCKHICIYVNIFVLDGRGEGGAAGLASGFSAGLGGDAYGNILDIGTDSLVKL